MTPPRCWTRPDNTWKEGTLFRSGKRGPLPEGDLQAKAPHEIATSILTLDEEEHADEDDADAILTREVQEEEGNEADQAIPEDEQPTRPQLTRAQRLLALRLAHGNPSQSDLQTARHLP